MLGFVQWFEKQILRVGLTGVVDAALAILSFGAVLSAVLGGPAVKAAAVVVAILVVLASFATLIASRSRWEAEHLRDRRLIARYCGVIQRVTGGPLHIVKWDDVTVIDPAGDAVETITVRARVEVEEAYFFRFRIGPAWDQSEKQRAKVVCDVRSELVNGSAGPRCDVSKTWLADGRLEVLAHLSSPVKAGADLRIRLDVKWPGMCEPLVKKRQPDNYLLCFARIADEVRYVIVLPQDEEVYVEPIGFSEGQKGYRIDVLPDVTGQLQVVLTAREVPARHRFGVRLDLK